jgi:hypothetical protein
LVNGASTTHSCSFFTGEVPLWESLDQFARAIVEPLLMVASPDPDPQKRAVRRRRKGT